MQDHYQILGISETAGSDEIKVAFKQKARLYHPDKHGGDPVMEERFKEINHAYQILSNPYEKARYDLMRNFGSVNFESPPPPPPPSYPPPPYTRPHYEAKVNYRENWVATAYAFGFTFIVAIIIMSGIYVKDYYDEKAWNELLQTRRATFEQAKQDYKEGNINSAFAIMYELGGFLKSEDDLELFKQKIITEAVAKSKNSFEREEYEQTIFYLELLGRYSEIPALELKENLAISYKKTNRPKKSIRILNDLLVSGYRNLFTFLEIAEIHRDMLKDDESANKYFIAANEVAKEYYRSIYGDAYTVVMSGSHLPEIHYQLYIGLADSYLRVGEYEKAVSATHWNKRMWPDSAAVFLIAAKGYLGLNEKINACAYFSIAQALDNSVAVPEECSN